MQRYAFDSAGIDPYDARAMANPLLERVAPKKRADLDQVIEIKGIINDFSRLAEVIEADLSALPEAKIPQQWRQAPVDIRLHFGWTEARPGVPVLEGHVSTSVMVVCQRCLDPFEFGLRTDLKLLLPQPGVSLAECDGYEVWESDEQDVRPADIIEEALIMALPFLALHESSDDCSMLIDAGQSDDGDTVQPFANLRSQMARAAKKH